jgi:hypothetical protein
MAPAILEVDTIKEKVKALRNDVLLGIGVDR